MSGAEAAKPERRFSGVLVPALTPFEPSLEPAAERFVGFCRWLLAEGANGLAVFGTTSEANSLGIEERKALLERLIAAGLPAARLMPGTGLPSLADTVGLTRHAVAAGCGGVLVLPPFYYKGVSDDGLFAFYAGVIERVGDRRLQLYLYHIPQVTGVPLGLALVERLAKAYPETVVGIKDSSGDWENTKAILRACPQLATFPSSESRLMEGLGLGAAGCISASANVNVRMIRALIDAWPGGEAERLNAGVSAVRAALERRPLIAALKGVFAAATGEPAWGVLRPPLVPMAQDAVATLVDELRAAGLDVDGPGFAGLRRKQAA
ncbi:MAG: dihydrodipicolinate synthase family protein [Dongiaceae bacterium]